VDNEPVDYTNACGGQTGLTKIIKDEDGKEMVVNEYAYCTAEDQAKYMVEIDDSDIAWEEE